MDYYQPQLMILATQAQLARIAATPEGELTARQRRQLEKSADTTAPVLSKDATTTKTTVSTNKTGDKTTTINVKGDLVNTTPIGTKEPVKKTTSTKTGTTTSAKKTTSTKIDATTTVKKTGGTVTKIVAKGDLVHTAPTGSKLVTAEKKMATTA